MAKNNQECGDELIVALQNGCEEAFTRIYKKYWYQMFLVAYRKLQNKEIAEEIVQDIFTRLWRDRQKVCIKSLDYYLFTSVRYEVIDSLRIQGSKNDYVDYYQYFISGHENNTQNTIEYNDLIKSIDLGLDVISGKSKEIFKLHRMEQWSIPQIAAHFNISEKAVEYHITKATKSLRIYLKENHISLNILSIGLFLESIL